MRITEKMAFSGSGLDRAAALRADNAVMDDLLKRGRLLPIWRGKPLLMAQEGLGWVSSDSAVLHHGSAPIFLGLDEDMPCFAVDISQWSPEAGAEAVAAGFLDQSEQHHPALPESFVFGELRPAMTRLTPREGELAATAKALLHWHRSHGFCAACGAASNVVMAGWQRSCPTCGAQHFPRTDPVVIMLITHGNRLLMGRDGNWPEGMYSCLAGFIEPGETIEAAVRREVFEEAGILVGDVRYLSCQPWPFPASLMIGCQGEALSEEITIDPAELEAALWVSREDMVLAMAGTHPVIKPTRPGTIARYLIENWLADQFS